MRVSLQEFRELVELVVKPTLKELQDEVFKLERENYQLKESVALARSGMPDRRYGDKTEEEDE